MASAMPSCDSTMQFTGFRISKGGITLAKMGIYQRVQHASMSNNDMAAFIGHTVYRTQCDYIESHPAIIAGKDTVINRSLPVWDFSFDHISDEITQ